MLLHQNGFLQFCFVTNMRGHTFDEYHPLVLSVLNSGATCIQLREKGVPDEHLLSIADRLLKMTAPYSIPLIVNDRVEICKAVGAHGVHLGQDDMPPELARTALGNEAIIGLSIENFQQLEIANQLDSITYVSASGVFPTKSKHDCKLTWGLDNLKKFCQLSRHPVMAIGGITLNNINHVLEAGAEGVAVISAIHDAEEPDMMTKAFRHEIDNFFDSTTLCHKN